MSAEREAFLIAILPLGLCLIGFPLAWAGFNLVGRADGPSGLANSALLFFVFLLLVLGMAIIAYIGATNSYRSSPHHYLNRGVPPEDLHKRYSPEFLDFSMSDGETIYATKESRLVFASSTVRSRIEREDFIWIANRTHRVFRVSRSGYGNRGDMFVYERLEELVQFLYNSYGLDAVRNLDGQLAWFPGDSEKPQLLDIAGLISAAVPHPDRAGS